MDDRTIKIAQKAMDAMRRDDGMNFDLLYLLEKVGATDAEAYRIEKYLLEEGLVDKSGGGYNLTAKGVDAIDLASYIKANDIIGEGKLAESKMNIFRWKGRWWEYLITFLLGIAAEWIRANVL